MHLRSLLSIAALTYLAASPVLAQTETALDKMKKDSTKAIGDLKGAKDAAMKAAQPEAANPMEDWRKFNQPGKEHLTLQKNMVGEWNATSKFWMAPNTEAMSSSGTARFSSAMGGRFVMQEHSGEIMGEKFKGLGFFGYNNGAKTFESFWIDNESTLMLTSSGTQQADGSIEWKGSYTDPMSGAIRTSRSVTRFQADGSMVYEMYDNGTDGTEFKSLEITYTRNADTKVDVKGDATPTTVADPHAHPAGDKQPH